MFCATFDEKNELWHGSDIPQLYNSNISVAQVVLRSMKVNGSKTAQINVDSGVQLSYNELRNKTIQCAQSLQKRGFEPKDNFAIMARNSDYVVPALFASFCLGCTAHMINPSLTKSEIVRILQMSKPRVMFCDADVYDVVAQCFEEINLHALIFTFNGMRGNSEPVENLFEENGLEESFIPVKVDGINDAVVKMASSGTTGPSKGIFLSHAAILSRVITSDISNGDDILFTFTTLDVLTTLLVVLMATHNGCTRVITTQYFSPKLQLRIIEDFGVTLVRSPANHIVLIVKSDLLPTTNLSSIRLHIVSSSKANIAALNEYNAYLVNGRALVAYGITEIGGYVTVNPNFNWAAGQFVSGLTVKIIDEHGNRCGVDVNGELCIKVPYKFLGYEGNEQLTKESFDNEGFYLTGDIGHVDKTGCFHIVDRKKDMIKNFNTNTLDGIRNISPSDIEGFLMASPKIKAACVVGIPDDVAVELPAAIIVRNNASDISSAEIIKMVEDNFTHIELCGGAYIVDSIPRTPSGKLLRREARAIAVKLFNEN